MKQYFYKEAATGNWIVGLTSNRVLTAGNYELYHKVVSTVDYFGVKFASSDQFKIESIPFSDWMDEAGADYASAALFLAAVKPFFFRLGGIFPTGTPLIFENSVTGFNYRIIVRDGGLNTDVELTATGFAGDEDTDWENLTGV